MNEEIEKGGEAQRIERIKELTGELDELDGQLYSLDTDHPDYSFKRDYHQGQIDVIKVEIFRISTDVERVRALEEKLVDSEEMYELSGGEFEVTIDSIIYDAFSIDVAAESESFSPYLKEEIERIKAENPWISG